MLVVETEQGERGYPDIADAFFTEIARKVRPHTLTFGSGAEGPWALYQSIEHIVRNKIPGDIVECGVWSGGSMLLAALALMHFGDTSRRIYLYDTFKVEDTIPATSPERISLLRLDTDLYSSTYHELLHLYPLLTTGGILIIDDYGAFQGAKLATDQFIAENKLPLFLSRIDVSVRLAVKPRMTDATCYPPPSIVSTVPVV
jgi:hypothetical protein